MGHRHSSDPTLLWLGHRLAATASIGPLAWESPCASGAAIEKTKKKKRQRQKTSKQNVINEVDPEVTPEDRS